MALIFKRVITDLSMVKSVKFMREIKKAHDDAVRAGSKDVRVEVSSGISHMKQEGGIVVQLNVLGYDK